MLRLDLTIGLTYVIARGGSPIGAAVLQHPPIILPEIKNKNKQKNKIN